MQYTKVTISLSKTDPYRDMLVYSLGDEGPYDSFEEMQGGLKAYVASHLFDQAMLEASLDELRQMDGELCCRWEAEQLPDKDYNEEWERQHQPVLIENFCWVRAPFHPHREDVKYEIEIEPKMSFGTAHHATTYLMLTLLEGEDVTGLRVLDMGSGTGVLAILAAKKGAALVDAIDVDEWAYRNAVENFERNGVKVNAQLGDASLLTSDRRYDVIMANINRNILLRDMGAYANVLAEGGMLLMSGFYDHDVEAIMRKGRDFGLSLVERRSRDGWCAIGLVKGC